MGNDDRLPPLFLERLAKILPRDFFTEVVQNFSAEKSLSVRINTLKSKNESVLEELTAHRIEYDSVAWCSDAFILRNTSLSNLEKTGLLQKGCLYIQGLSSLLPALILNPQPGDHLLDMCAAPGSKTTQMAAHMNNRGSITALDNVKERYYKLKNIIALLGAHIVNPRLTDARRFRAKESLFDKILVDAPCSSEGRFKIHDKKSFAYWSPRKIKEMAQKQKGLLLSAARLLKVGGELVYSTCTFAPEENEGVLDWFLKKTSDAFDVCPISLAGIKTYGPIVQWQKRQYTSKVLNAVRILPDGAMEGFFIAKFHKKRNFGNHSIA